MELTRYENTEKDGSRKTVSVEQVENGYVITIDTYTPSSNSGEKYIDSKYECKKYISKTNPFKKEESEMDLASVLAMC